MRAKSLIYLLTALAALWAPNPLASQTAAAGEGTAFSFVVLGHLRSEANGEENPLLGELIEKVRELRPDLVFLTGDNIWGFVNVPLADSTVVLSDWERLDSRLATLGVPVYRVPGNHDINDPVTRDVFFRRYGKLPRAVRYGNSLFLLLNTAYVPPGDKPTRKYIQTTRLDPDQVRFVRKAVSEGSYAHVFVFTHHVLWWRDDAPWWKDVHPVLASGKGGAVFAGDLGPTLFTYLRRDGVEYFRSAIYPGQAAQPATTVSELRDALQAQQFDNFLYVRVKDDEAKVSVQTVGEFSGRFSPERWRKVFGAVIEDQQYVYDPDDTIEGPALGLTHRIWRRIGTPRRLAALTVFLIGVFFLGALSGVTWSRRRSA